MPKIKNSMLRLSQHKHPSSTALDAEVVQGPYQRCNLEILNIASVWLNCGDNVQPTKIIKPAKIY